MTDTSQLLNLQFPFLIPFSFNLFFPFPPKINLVFLKRRTPLKMPLFSLLKAFFQAAYLIM